MEKFLEQRGSEAPSGKYRDTPSGSKVRCLSIAWEGTSRAPTQHENRKTMEVQHRHDHRDALVVGAKS
jgi:hypothetical protein